MVLRETKHKGSLDLSSYDLEYAELLSVDWRKKINEIELKLRCPVAGWFWKEKRIRFLRALGLSTLLSDTCLQYTLTLAFLGVSEVTDTLISQGHTLVGVDPSDTTWMRSIIFEIESIQIVKIRAGVSRLYLRAEDFQLDFNFVDFIFHEKCIDR